MTTGRWLNRPAVVALAYLAAALIFYAPIVLGLRTFPDGDFTHHFLPFSLFQQQELLAGRLPLWNPYTYSGHPFLADVQAAVFYPISNAVLLLTLPLSGPGARLYFLQIEAIVQIALAGFFTYLLLRDLLGNRWAAFTGGLIFAFSGYLTGYPPVQLAVLRSAIWLPLILCLLWRGFGEPGRWRWWIGAGAAAAVAFLGGHPQTVLFIGYTVLAWVLFLLISGLRSGVPDRRSLAGRQLAGLLFAGLIVAGLSAAQALPSIEFTRFSVRADVSYDFMSGGFPLQDTWQMLLPGVFTVYSPLYIGVAGLGLAAAGLLLLRDRKARQELVVDGADRPASTRGLVIFFAVLSLVALLLSYGRNGFLYPIFYWLAPGWKLFRGQERTAYLVAFGLSVLAGYGMAAIPHLSPVRRHRLALIFGGLVTAGVYAFGLIWQLNGRTAIDPWAYLGIALVTLLLGVGFALLIWLGGWSARRSTILTALVLANLFWVNFATNLAPFNPVRKTILAPEMAALGQVVDERSDANLGLSGRVYNESRIYEDYGMRQQIEDVWGSSPLRLAGYSALFKDFPLDRLFDLTGVEHVLTWRRELFEPSELLGEFPQQADTTYLHRLDDPNPRAWVVGEIEVTDDETALVRLADHGHDLRRIALVSDDSGVDITTVGDEFSAAGEAAIRLTRLAPNRLQVQVENADGLLLVLAENWMPGWRTEPPLPVVRTNVAQIGVALPGPDVEFELIYDPHSVRVGLILSGLTLLVLGLSTVVMMRIARRGMSSDGSTTQLGLHIGRVRTRARLENPMFIGRARDVAGEWMSGVLRLGRRTSCPDGKRVSLAAPLAPQPWGGRLGHALPGLADTRAEMACSRNQVGQSEALPPPRLGAGGLSRARDVARDWISAVLRLGRHTLCPDGRRT